MKTFLELQNILNEGLNAWPDDPAGVPNFLHNRLPTHVRLYYHEIWKLPKLSYVFETRIKQLGGVDEHDAKRGTFGFFIGTPERERSGHPTRKHFFTNGRTAHESFHKRNKLHKTDGPALTEWDRDGRVERQEFWVNGKRTDQ